MTSTAEAAASGDPIDRRVLAIAIVAVLVPVVVTAAAITRREWFPTGDRAIEVLQIGDVGGRRTPLTGVYSRFGWDHPGPLLFWVLAPFERLLGSRGVLLGVGVVNATSLVITVIAARRRGGWPLVGLVAATVTMLAAAGGTDLLIDPWNPWVAVLPYLSFLMAAWCVGDGDHRWSIVLVVTGSFLVQIHVGYAPLVLAVGAAAAVLGRLGRRGRADADDGHATSAAVALGVGAVLWLPPIVQQVGGADGNLAAIVGYAADPREPAAGWSTAWGVLGTEIGFPGAWLSGSDDGFFGVRTGSVGPAIVVLVVVAGLGALAWRRGAAGAGRLAVIALVAVLAGFVATARVTGPVWTYVVRWWWVTAALVWLSVIWSACSIAGRRDVRNGVGAVALAAAVVIACVLGWRAVPVGLPEQPASMAAGRLGEAVAAHIDPDGRFILEAAGGRGWGGAIDGLFAELDRRGVEVAVPPDQAPPHEVWRTREHRAGWTVLVVADDDDLIDAIPLPAGAEPIIRYDPLRPSERARADDLLERLMADARRRDPRITVADAIGDASLGVHPVDGVPIAELNAYRARGQAITVFAVPG